MATLPTIYLSQSAVQAGTTHFESSNPWFFEQVNKIQSVVYALNLGAIFIGVKELVDGLEPWLGFYENLAADNLVEVYFFGMLFAGIAWAIAAAYIVGYINDYFKPQEDLRPHIAHLSNEVQRDVAVSWDNTTYQVLMQGFHLTHAVISVALVFFSTNPYFYAVSGALQLYSLWKTTEWKSIRVDRVFDMQNPMNEGAVRFNFSYYFAVLPPSRQEDCPVCQERPAAALWHGEHQFCYPCVISHIAVHSDEINRYLDNQHVQSVHNIERENGFIRREYMSHAMQLPRAAIPTCPSCRDLSVQNPFEIQVTHRFRTEQTHALVEDIRGASIRLLEDGERPQVPA